MILSTGEDVNKSSGPGLEGMHFASDFGKPPAVKVHRAYDLIILLPSTHPGELIHRKDVCNSNKKAETTSFPSTGGRDKLSIFTHSS